MKTVFEYLTETENRDFNFHFDRSGNHLVISYSGFKHMHFYKIREHLQLHYKLKYDFDKGYEKFDSRCGRTYCYFKDVYKEVV